MAYDIMDLVNPDKKTWQMPGMDTASPLQFIRDNSPEGFSMIPDGTPAGISKIPSLNPPSPDLTSPPGSLTTSPMPGLSPLTSPSAPPTGMGTTPALPTQEPTVFGVPASKFQNLMGGISGGLGIIANALNPRERPGQGAIDVEENRKARELQARHLGLEERRLDSSEALRQLTEKYRGTQAESALKKLDMQMNQMEIEKEKQNLRAEMATLDPDSPEWDAKYKRYIAIADYAKEVKGTSLDPFAKEKDEKAAALKVDPGHLIATINDPNSTPEQVALARKNLQGQQDYAIKTTGAKAQATATAYDPQAQKIGAAIIAGTQPPELSGFGMARLTPGIRSYLADQGYDLTKASEDWMATKKMISTMNGTQQVRLRQAVGFASESLDVVENLTRQWKAGNFPLLNKANLALARNGAYGQEAAKIATGLQTQIADLTSELGTVYKGGNSSTDESLKLAAENLKAEWSEEVLLSNIELVRKNLEIRKNSIRNSGYMGRSISKPESATEKPLEESQASSIVSKYFSKEDRGMAQKVLQGESGRVPGAINTNKNKTQDSGLFQINDSNIPELQKAGIIKDKADLKDPDKNAQAASYLKKQYGWKPWKSSIFAAIRKSSSKDVTDKQIHDYMRQKGYE